MCTIKSSPGYYARMVPEKIRLPSQHAAPESEKVVAEEVAVDVPQDWPADVVYLANHSVPSESLVPSLALHLCTAPKASHEIHPAQTRSRRWTTIRVITEDTPFQAAFGSSLTTHPTLGQRGLFAGRDIPPHTLVVPYLGEVHLASEEDAESRYDAAIGSDDGVKLGIDATRAGNEARCELGETREDFRRWALTCSSSLSSRE